MDNNFNPENKQPKPDLNLIVDGNNITEAPTTFNPKKLHHKRKLGELNNKEKVIFFVEIVIAIVILVLVIYLIDKLFFKSTPPPPAPVKKSVVMKVAPVPITSRLSGLPVTAAQAALPVTGVMIENTPDARPQSGLNSAGVVFDALAEGGITRFLALFEEGQPSSLGPVRSARPYYVDWADGFNATYVHAGGSPDGLAAIQTLQVKNIDGLVDSSAFHRITTRIAPHNLYTSSSALSTLETSKGYTVSNFTGFPRKADTPLKTPTVNKIGFNPSYSTYSSSWVYIPQANAYNEDEDGAPLVDANTNVQIQSKVVIAMVVPWTYGALDSTGANYVDYSDIGSGTAYIFQDGGVTAGSWTKPSAAAQITFTDATGAPIKLNAGQTWISVLGAVSQLSYSI